jgi:membrane protein
MAFTVGAVVLALLALAILIAVPPVLGLIKHPSVPALLLTIGRWPILLVLVGFALSLVYRFGPCRAAPRWRWITWGSALAAIAWLAASALFSWYVANFGSYDKTYGSLGAIIGFMTWIWVSIIVVLIGAKLDAEIEPWAGRAGRVGIASTMTGASNNATAGSEFDTPCRSDDARAGRSRRPVAPPPRPAHDEFLSRLPQTRGPSRRDQR